MGARRLCISIATVTFVIGSVILSLADSQGVRDIEDLFMKEFTADFSGKYSISGVTPDEEDYTGSVELKKWNTFTTQRGNTLQSYHVTFMYGETKSEGLAVFDGSRLYVATGDPKNKNWYLMLLGDLQLDVSERSALFEYWNKNWGPGSKSSESFEWKGKAPWYGYLNISDETYGYWFFMDGAWGCASTRRAGWPLAGDSCAYHLRELKKDGEHTKDALKVWTEAAGLSIADQGVNLYMEAQFFRKEEKNYDCFGMMIDIPLHDRQILVAMMGGPNSADLGCYQIVGRKFVAEWMGRGAETRGTEEWEIPDEVVKKSPGYFQ